MKRLILSLSIVAVLGLIGCSNSEETDNNPSQSQQTEQTAEPTEDPTEELMAEPTEDPTEELMAEPTDEPTDSSNMESNEGDDELPNFSEIIPDPKSIFKKGKVSVINYRETYACQVDGYSIKEYRKYIKEAKKKGFKYDMYENEELRTFKAYTSDNKYSLALLCEKDSDSLLISCQ